MRRFMITIGLCVSLAGCASTPDVSADAGLAGALNGKTLAVARREPANLSIMTYGRAMGMMFGAVGGAATGLAITSAGQQAITQFHLEDPSNTIGANISKAMEARFHVRTGTPVTVANKESYAAVASRGGDADYVLDVQTQIWTVLYLPGNLTHYRVDLTSIGKLVEVKSSKVLAMHKCDYKSPRNEAITYDELMQNQGAGMKRLLNASRETCETEISRALLGGG